MANTGTKVVKLTKDALKEQKRILHRTDFPITADPLMLCSLLLPRDLTRDEATRVKNIVDALVLPERSSDE